jgi:hypothetical protein
MEEPIFDFLALPAELRVKVYVYYMHGGRKITDPHALNICFLNRQVRAEFEDEAIKIRKQITDEIWRRFKNELSFDLAVPQTFRRFHIAQIRVELHEDPEAYPAEGLHMMSLLRGFLGVQLPIRSVCDCFSITAYYLSV